MFIILVAFVVGTIFFNWGMNAGGPKNAASVAGTINGKDVPLQAFDQQVNSERQRLQGSRGEVPPYQNYMIPRQVWDQQVQHFLTKEIIDRLKISASADEVFEYIKNNPLPGMDTAQIFQTNGQFDKSKYEQFLNNPKNYDMYPWLRNIEEYTRTSVIPFQKLEKILNAGAMTTKSEIEYEYNQSKSKVVYEYVKVNHYMMTIDTSKFTNADIEKFYNAHRDSFNVDNQIDLYYAKFPKVATANDDKVYYQQLVELKQKILQSGKISESFAEEAKIESDDEGSAQNGGDLGLFGKGQMVPEFDSVAFSTDTGIISDPVKTQFGYHLILVESKQQIDGQVKIKARHILKKIVPTIETLDMLAEKADSLKLTVDGKNFVETVKKFPGAEVDSTGLFKRGEMIPKIGYVSGIGQFAFANDKNKISERLENNDAIYIFSIKQRTKKGAASLSDVKSKVITMLTDSLRKDAVKEYIVNIKKKVNDSTSLATLKEGDPKLFSGITDTVSIDSYIPGIGYNSKVSAIAYTMKEGTISNPIEFEKNYYLVKTLWKKSVMKVLLNLILNMINVMVSIKFLKLTLVKLEVVII
jgi:peptidyl-prolyl cis-trans isomerase D